ISISANVKNLIDKEKDAQLKQIEGYTGLQKKAQQVKFDFLNFLLEAKKEGKKVAAYGAAAKGNTLLNFCGVKNDLIEFVVDKSPYKQGKYLPGSHIQIVSPEYLKKTKPDYLIILPWNIKNEITAEHDYIKNWGGKFITAIP